MDDAVVAYPAALVDLHARIENAVLSHSHPVPEINLRIYLSAFSHPDPPADIRKRSHIDPLAQTGRPCHMRRESRAAPLFRFEGVEQVEQGRHGLIGIVHFDQRSTDFFLRFERFVYEDDTCLASIQIMFVFRIGKKAESAGLARLYTRHGRHLRLRVADNLTS